MSICSKRASGVVVLFMVGMYESQGAWRKWGALPAHGDDDVTAILDAIRSKGKGEHD